MATRNGAPLSCPKCGSLRLYPNPGIRKNPKAPLWRCLESNCNGALWPTADELAIATGTVSTLGLHDPEIDRSCDRAIDAHHDALMAAKAAQHAKQDAA